MIAGENVAKQHRLLVCRMNLETKKRNQESNGGNLRRKTVVMSQGGD